MSIIISFALLNIPGLPINLPDISNISLPQVPDLSALTGNISKVLEILLSMTQNGDMGTNMLYDTFLPSLEKTMDSYSLILIILSLILGLMCGFCGYKLVRFLMTISGFFTGLSLGIIVATRFLHGSNGIVILCAGVGALLLSLFSCKIYRAGIFILCFFLGFIASANYIPLTGNIAFFVCLICGLVVGILALKFVKPVIIVSSALVGAHSAANSIIGIGEKLNVTWLMQGYSTFLVFAVLLLMGILFQFLTTMDRRKK